MKVLLTPIPHNYNFFLVMRTFKIYFLNSQRCKYSIINYSHHAVHYILLIYLFYIWEIVHLLTIFPQFPYPLPLATINLVFVSMSSGLIWGEGVFVVLFLRFHTEVRSYGICLPLSDLSHVA